MSKSGKIAGTILAGFYIAFQAFKVLVGYVFLFLVARGALDGFKTFEPTKMLMFIIYAWIILTCYEVIKSIIQTLKRTKNVRKKGRTNGHDKGSTEQPSKQPAKTGEKC